MYLDDKGEVIEDASLKGYLAVAVPGSVLGLDTMLAKYGTMKRAQVMAPAIKLAEEGFVLTAGRRGDPWPDHMKRSPSKAMPPPSSCKDGKPLQGGRPAHPIRSRGNAEADCG